MRWFLNWEINRLDFLVCIMDTAVSCKNVRFDFINVVVWLMTVVTVVVCEAATSVVRVSRCVLMGSVSGCSKDCSDGTCDECFHGLDE